MKKIKEGKLKSLFWEEKIELLKEARKFLENKTEDTICFALSSSISKFLHDKQGCPRYWMYHTAFTQLMDYIGYSLGNVPMLHTWLSSNYPITTEYANAISRDCRLAWIDAMIVSIETGYPVQGNCHLTLMPRGSNEYDGNQRVCP